eukprot:CAMPEP_0170321750 /NCGR_PEP_ID=MMETSP0116_2-20130129/61643_1 /TAXON_ID=400756 /ORGANISM="Durinskia baltica, Strain CSIRO CS-38" /LENGTH=395 /DNA_ID=CAMNT_0010574589 /DNA_START=1 /DNA_END=1184 /DNA_ORIENTATION=+
MIVDTERGLVICDRNTAPGPLCDALLTFGSSCTVPAHCVYVHPLHNLAVLRYDPRQLEGTEVEAVQLKRCAAHDLRGQKLWFVTSIGSMRRGCKLVSERGVAIDSEANVAPLSNPPRWQETNIDLLAFKGGGSIMHSQDGIVSDGDGQVVAYYASFLTQTVRNGRLQDGQYFAGITADTIEDMLEALRRGEPPVRYALGVELEKLGLSAARGMLLDAATTEEVEAQCEHRRRWAGTGAFELLQDSDIILRVDGRRVETFRDVETAADVPEAELLVVRNGEKLNLRVRTAPVADTTTDRLILWSGAVLQAAPAAIAAQRGQELAGVYVSSRFHGSPATRYNLPVMSRVIEVDGEKVPDLDAFVRTVAAKPDGADVRLKLLDLRGAPSMACLRVDNA